MSNSLAEEQVEELLGVIMSYARLDFSKQAPVSNQNDSLDAISTGINMLGEELESSMVSLKEKDQLLREVHHRVKNNMQIISSMLRLHSSMTENPVLSRVVEDCQSRITAMALIHEMLYASHDFKHTNLREYTRNLVQSINISYAKSGSKVAFDVDISEDIFFDIDRLIPLGLIINESVCNSMKHAFPDGEGKVYVRLTSSDDRHILEVGDNGKGLPPEYDAKAKSTLGMQLIFMLSEQLDCETTLINKNGVHYHIRL